MLKSTLEDYEIMAVVGSPDVEIIKYANGNNIDMIILGALGIPEKERVTRIRTAANVSKFAPCQVMVIQKMTQPGLGI
jgi:nucleotide-binding universal stress UspA family protein